MKASERPQLFAVVTRLQLDFLSFAPRAELRDTGVTVTENA